MPDEQAREAAWKRQMATALANVVLPWLERNPEQLKAAPDKKAA